MNGIGIRITELRKQAGMSQFQLAKVLDIATSTLGMYETGKREPSLKVLMTPSRKSRDFSHGMDSPSLRQ